MPDALDRAADLEQQQRNRALNAQRGKVDFTRPSATECEDCGDGISAERRAFGGVTRCVECQSQFERRK